MYLMPPSSVIVAYSRCGNSGSSEFKKRHLRITIKALNKVSGTKLLQILRDFQSS